MRLHLYNNFNKKEYDLDAFDVKDTRNFYHFSVKLPKGIQDGEYTYTLYGDDDEVLASSLLQIGEYTPSNTTYVNNNNEYTVYEG